MSRTIKIKSEGRRRVVFVLRFLGSFYATALIMLVIGVFTERYYPSQPLWLWPVAITAISLGVVGCVWTTYVYLKRND